MDHHLREVAIQLSAYKLIEEEFRSRLEVVWSREEGSVSYHKKPR